MNTVKQVARKERANSQVFASASSDPRKNPLDQTSKVKFMKKMFKGSNIKSAGGNQRTFMEILKTYDKMYGKVIMIAGSDRINEFQKLADKYNGKDYSFKSLKVVSADDYSSWVSTQKDGIASNEVYNIDPKNDVLSKLSTDVDQQGGL